MRDSVSLCLCVQIMERDREKMVRYLQQRYWYDRTAGVVRNRKGQVINGFDNGRGYLKFDARFDGNRFVTRLHHLVWVLVYGRFPKQQLRLVVRESYYRVAYHVFNYLRRNRQLARREGAFDKDVKLVLTSTLSRLLVEYGAGKD